MGYISDCSICNGPAPIGEAVIEVDSYTAGDIQRTEDHREFKSRREHVESGGGLRVTTLGRVPLPVVIDWEWNHQTCSDAADKGRGYSFDASRMSNSAEALGWTLHLYKKTWLPATNWREFVEDLGFSSDS